MHGRIPRLVMAVPLVAVLAVTLTASGGPATTERSGSDRPSLPLWGRPPDHAALRAVRRDGPLDDSASGAGFGCGN